MSLTQYERIYPDAICHSNNVEGGGEEVVILGLVTARAYNVIMFSIDSHTHTVCLLGMYPCLFPPFKAGIA